MMEWKKAIDRIDNSLICQKVQHINQILDRIIYHYYDPRDIIIDISILFKEEK